MWTWIMGLDIKNMIIIALVSLILGCGIYIGIQKIEISHKTATIISQEASIKSLERANDIMNQNAVAARKAQDEMQKVVAAAVGLKTIIKGIPDEVRRGLKNETLEKVNHCIGQFFRDGMLSVDCSASGAVLPKAVSAGMAGGGGKSP